MPVFVLSLAFLLTGSGTDLLWPDAGVCCSWTNMSPGWSVSSAEGQGTSQGRRFEQPLSQGDVTVAGAESSLVCSCVSPLPP